MLLDLVLASNGQHQAMFANNLYEARRNACLVLQKLAEEQRVYIVNPEQNKIVDIVRRCNLTAECSL